jgi:REP element-mobilizing transposase RayT
VTSGGDRREDILSDDQDRDALLQNLAQALSRFDAQVLAYCLMGNHYHFVLHTRQANLSSLMRHINAVYTQTYNRRDRKVGHLFQGGSKRFWVIAMPICSKFAATWIGTRYARGCYASLSPGRGQVTGRTWDKLRCPSGWTLQGCTVACSAGRRRAPPIAGGRLSVTRC